MMRITWRIPLRWLGLILLLTLAAGSWAGIGLSIGTASGSGWQVDGLSLDLADAAPGAYQLKLSAAQLALPGKLGTWRDLSLACPAMTLGTDGYHCPAVQLWAVTPYGKQHLRGELHYLDDAHWSLHLTDLTLAGGKWQVDAKADGAWRLALQGRGVKIDRLLALADGVGLPAWGWHGRLAVQAKLQGQGTQPTGVDATISLKDGAWSSPDGLQAAEALGGRMRLQAHYAHARWRGELHSTWDGGQVYSDPVFVTLDQQPLQLDTLWSQGGGDLQLSGLNLQLGKLVSLAAKAELPLAAPLQGNGQVEVSLPDLAGLYPVLLQPLAYGGPLAELDITGTTRLSLDWRQGKPTKASLKMSGLHMDDHQGRFGVSDLAGELHWQDEGETPPSTLQWQGGHLYRVDFGASKTEFGLMGDRVSLYQPLVLPMLDGVLRIPSFQASGLGTDHPTWRTALKAEALSLPALTQALKWPVLDGALSVEIPAVHYADDVLALDGELVAQAFDGVVRVTGLQLQDPLGPAPMFTAEASLRGLDLERLTKVFDFGRITGRLDGDVRGLQLVGWEPVAFQAELRTPPGDTSRHRISQRAVENLTKLGNNGAAALSGTFLRFFESFSYDRLRLEVNLAGQVATLDGITHPQGGYYLVKGAGLPRIDVIGRNRRIAWRDLIERLRTIRLEGAQIR